jgi:hypothetical protein
MTTSQQLQAGAGWGGRLRIAARVASDHGELWLPGALATMCSIGWLPFVLAVVPAPSDGDLAFLASSVVLSPSFPLNLVLPAIALVATVIAATLLSATGEAVLLRSMGRLQGFDSPGPIDDLALRVWLIRAVASVPPLVAAVLLLALIAAVGPGEYQSPDLGRGPLLVRIAADVWPLLVLELVAIIGGLALAMGALRASIRERATLRGAMAAAAHDLLRHPLRRMSQAIVVEAGLATWLVATWALLRLLWVPISRHAQDGTLLGPISLLLIGFVAIWLCLVAGAGVLRVWSSAWWFLDPATATPAAEPGAQWT